MINFNLVENFDYGFIEYSIYDNDNIDLNCISFYEHDFQDIKHFDNNGELLSEINKVIIEGEFKRILFIRKIEINEDYRGKGYGTAYLRKMIETMSPDITMLIATPYDDEDISIEELSRFYNNLGIDEVIKIKDKDAIFMAG